MSDVGDGETFHPFSIICERVQSDVIISCSGNTDGKMKDETNQNQEEKQGLIIDQP